MADNTPQTGNANIAADDITTMNGGAITAGTALAQRMKVGFGADSFFRDVEPLFPFPVYDPDTLASGTIAALIGSVSINLNSDSAMRVQITGTWVGTLQFEATVDGTNWIPVNAVQAGSTVIPQNTTGNGVFSPTPSGFASFRVNATAWTSGTATVSIRTSSGAGGVYLNQYLPAFSVTPAFKLDQSINSADVTMQNAAVAAGNGTVLPTTGYGTALIQIAGTFIGTITFEATLDGTNYFPISAVQAGTSIIATTATVPGIYRLVSVGLTNIRARISAYTSGSITALGRTTNAPFAGKVITLSSSSAVALVAGAAAIGTVGVTSLPALVAGAAVIGAVTQSGTWNIGSITTLPALVAGTAIVGKFGIDQSTPGTTNLVSIGTNGTVAINAALPTGANTIGALTANQTVNVSQMNGVAVTMGSGVTGTGVQRVVLATDVPLPAPATPTASTISSAATTNATSIKASAGTIYSITVSNVGAAAAFVKIFNLAAAPTVGTSVPTLTIPVAASGVANINFGAQGVRFGTGIALSITNLVADADATAVAAAQVKVLTSYI